MTKEPIARIIGDMLMIDLDADPLDKAVLMSISSMNLRIPAAVASSINERDGHLGQVKTTKLEAARCAHQILGTIHGALRHGEVRSIHPLSEYEVTHTDQLPNPIYTEDQLKGEE